jgi:hypothetical protein
MVKVPFLNKTLNELQELINIAYWKGSLPEYYAGI